MEVQTEVPTGTRLRIDADRQFEGQQGDSVLRIQGERPEGGQVFDATYVEVEHYEAQAIAKILRSLTSPPPEQLDEIAREVQATFGSRLGGRDAQQIAQMAVRSQAQLVGSWLGTSVGSGDISKPQEQLEYLAERFERAAAKKRNAPSWSQQSEGDGQGQQAKQTS